MSRRHHGRPHHHGPGGADRGRRSVTGPGAAPGAGAGLASESAAATPAAGPAEAQAPGPRPYTNGIDVAAAGVVDDPRSRPNAEGNGHDPSAVGHQALDGIRATPVNGATMGMAAPLTNGHAPSDGHASSGVAVDV